MLMLTLQHPSLSAELKRLAPATINRSASEERRTSKETPRLWEFYFEKLLLIQGGLKLFLRLLQRFLALLFQPILLKQQKRSGMLKKVTRGAVG
jgi:hypothetical protein